MSITLTKEKHFVVLLSIVDLGGAASKKEVLDNIQDKEYYALSEQDLEMKTNRPELRWRNDLAFIRKQLVDNGYVDRSIRNLWSITDSGREYFATLCSNVLEHREDDFYKLTSNVVHQVLTLSTLNSFENELTRLERDFLEDKISKRNETEDVVVRRVKRYRKIVDDLKKMYKGRCQIENCGFTFLKTSGENYAEGHHLMSLASGGSQDTNNVVILCANHHRMFHYASVEINEFQSKKRRKIILNGNINYLLYKKEHRLRP